MLSTHLSFSVPPGLDHVLFFPVDGGWLENLRFIFGGKQRTLLIQRIDARCSTGQVSFTDATPHEATVWFAHNHFVRFAPFGFYITVDNVGDATEWLQVTALYERDPDQPLDPPCGV